MRKALVLSLSLALLASPAVALDLTSLTGGNGSSELLYQVQNYFRQQQYQQQMRAVEQQGYYQQPYSFHGTPDGYKQVNPFNQTSLNASTATIPAARVPKEWRATSDAIILRKGTNLSGEPCREFEQPGVLNGRPVSVHGISCIRNGVWQLIQPVE